MRECPFCGSDNVGINQTIYKSPNIYKVICDVCGSSGPESESARMAIEKWDGFLMTLKEDMGGVSAPAATLANVPGVGTAQPAAMAAMTGAQQYDQGAIGSGDKWGGGNAKPLKRKKRKKVRKQIKKHKIASYDEYSKKVKTKINGLTKR